MNQLFYKNYIVKWLNIVKWLKCNHDEYCKYFKLLVTDEYAKKFALHKRFPLGKGFYMKYVNIFNLINRTENALNKINVLIRKMETNKTILENKKSMYFD